MNTSLRFCLHRAWLRLQLPAFLLVALLQRSPALRLFETARQFIAGPASGVLPWSIAALGALGATHSLAGATTLIASSSSPLSVTAGQEMVPVAFSVSNTINIGSWRISGNVPPGLKFRSSTGTAEIAGPGVLDATTPGTGGDPTDPYGGGTTGNLMTLPVLTGTPTQSGSFTFSLEAFELGGTTGLAAGPFSFTVTVAAAQQNTGTAPSFISQPAAQSVAAGGSVTFTATISGNPTPTYQWLKDGSPIDGATSATLTLTNVQPAAAGSYAVRATNSAGATTSTAAQLTVTTPATGAPVISGQPASQTVSAGSTVVFGATATGAASYQWRKDGAAIGGATNAMLVISPAKASDAGSYSVLVSNSAGSVPSAAAVLSVGNEANFGHLINLSISTAITAGDPSFTVGTVIGGAGTQGTKPLLVRAVGPTLGAFGVPGTISDPKMEFFAASGTSIATNDNWGGGATLANVFSSVGAFAMEANSKDAAVYNAGLSAGGYTVQVSGTNGATGAVLAELYDAGGAGNFSAAAPRLINVSVNKQLAAGNTLVAGFVIGGNTSRTVLVRAVGPGLAAFGVPGTMPDPQLALFGGSTKIAQNDNWGGDAQITAAGSAVGAFAISDKASKDAMLLVTLAPGNYTAEVGSTGAGGQVLVEVYEVP